MKRTRIETGESLYLAAKYLADGAPQEWPDALEDDVRAKDGANLVAGSFKISLDLLDRGFKLSVIGLSKARIIGRCEKVSHE
jgi:hypothetical protein